MKYYSVKTVTKILGVTAQTLRNWVQMSPFYYIEKNEISKQYI